MGILKGVTTSTSFYADLILSILNFRK